MKAVLCALAAAVLSMGQPLAERLDSIAGAGVRENRAVGLVAAVVRGKDTLLLKAYGKADVEAGAPMTLDTVLPIGSVTKQFTAAAIVLLRDEGKLTLDDAVTKWLPDFDTHGNTVTLRHLLAHTSGVAEMLGMQEFREMQLFRNPKATSADVYKVVNTYPFRFATGSMETYSNTNFWLLGLVIEKASGMSYEDYVEKKIFARLGMTRSMYCNPAEKVPQSAAGYFLRNGMTRRAPDIIHTGTFASGALCSTGKDMVTWLQALHGGKLFSARSYAEFIAPSKLNDGTVLRYALGTDIGEDRRGHRYIGHDGGGFGFSSQVRWYRDGSLAVVMLTNSEPDGITVTTEDLAAEVLPAAKAPGPFTGDAELLAGKYKGQGRAGEMVIDVARTPEGMTFAIDGAAAGALPYVGDWTFRRGNALLVFRRSGNSGPATELRFDTAGGHFILKRTGGAR